MENKQALSYVIGVEKKSDDSQNLMSYENYSSISKVKPIPQILSTQNSMVKPFVTVCQMCPNRPVFIRNGPLTYQTDFESKLKIITQWLQSVPIQLI